jgi:hypothetical protein
MLTTDGFQFVNSKKRARKASLSDLTTPATKPEARISNGRPRGVDIAAKEPAQGRLRLASITLGTGSQASSGIIADDPDPDLPINDIDMNDTSPDSSNE